MTALRPSRVTSLLRAGRSKSRTRPFSESPHHDYEEELHTNRLGAAGRVCARADAGDRALARGDAGVSPTGLRARLRRTAAGRVMRLGVLRDVDYRESPEAVRWQKASQEISPIEGIKSWGQSPQKAHFAGGSCVMPFSAAFAR